VMSIRGMQIARWIKCSFQLQITPLVSKSKPGGWSVFFCRRLSSVQVVGGRTQASIRDRGGEMLLFCMDAPSRIEIQPLRLLLAYSGSRHLFGLAACIKCFANTRT